MVLQQELAELVFRCAVKDPSVTALKVSVHSSHCASSVLCFISFFAPKHCKLHHAEHNPIKVTLYSKACFCIGYSDAGGRVELAAAWSLD